MSAGGDHVISADWAVRLCVLTGPCGALGGSETLWLAFYFKFYLVFLHQELYIIYFSRIIRESSGGSVTETPPGIATYYATWPQATEEEICVILLTVWRC